jgi:hypothetical protein
MPSLRVTVKNLDGVRPRRRIRRQKVKRQSQRGSPTLQRPQPPPTSFAHRILTVNNPDSLPRHPTPGELYQSSAPLPPYSTPTPSSNRIRHAAPQARRTPHDPPPPYSILNQEPPKSPQRLRKKTSRTITLKIQIGRRPRN